MADVSGPVIIRRNPVNYLTKPGVHSHNASRRIARTSARYTSLDTVRIVLYVIGICALGYYAYTLSDQYVYQAFENWAFDQQIAGRPAVTFGDYLREKTPFGFLVGEKAAPSEKTTAAETATPSQSPEQLRPPRGSLLGRVEISRLNVSAMVREGVDANVLGIAVGHVPSTSLPGQTGNFAIAAHRDTLFRALKDIKKHDLVTFQSPSGTYTYEVAATKIVKPSDTTVLQRDGGGLIPFSENDPADDHKLLTMITCYPFYYVGAAPKRFIVEATLVSTNPVSNASGAEANAEPAATETPPPVKRKIAKHSRLVQPRHLRGFLQPRRVAVSSALSTNKPVKKPGFWHRLFHVS